MRVLILALIFGGITLAQNQIPTKVKNLELKVDSVRGWISDSLEAHGSLDSTGFSARLLQAEKDIDTVMIKTNSLIYHSSQKTLKGLIEDGYEKYIQPLYNGVIDSLTYQTADSSFNFSLFISDNPDGSDSTDILTTSLTATPIRQVVSVFMDSTFTKYQFIFIKINSVSGVQGERGYITLYTKEN